MAFRTPVGRYRGVIRKAFSRLKIIKAITRIKRDVELGRSKGRLAWLICVQGQLIRMNLPKFFNYKA